MAAFVLAQDAPATIEVIDVTGRRVLTREVGSLGPGRHTIRFEEGRSLPAGVYMIRLHQADRSLLARGVVIH